MAVREGRGRARRSTFCGETQKKKARKRSAKRAAWWSAQSSGGWYAPIPSGIPVTPGTAGQGQSGGQGSNGSPPPNAPSQVGRSWNEVAPRGGAVR